MSPPKTPLTSDERISGLIKIGLDKGYLLVKNSRVTYTCAEKEYNFDDPEEQVRAAAYVELIENYKYSAYSIDLEVRPPRREPKLPADIVVYDSEKKEHVFIVTEVKAEANKATIDEAIREGLGNSNLLGAKFLWIVAGAEKFAFNVEGNPTLDNLNKHAIAVIPERYGKVPKYLYKKTDPKWDLRRATFNELSSIFQLAHDEIWEGGRRDPAVAFDEVSKLMFAKIYDERFTPSGEYYSFQVGTGELPSEVLKRVEDKYEKAREKVPEVFRSKMMLPADVVFRIVEVLQDISLINTDLDAKGRAFESFLGKLFRGEYGQYFTRREIVEFAVNMINPDEQDIIMDPACGSGGFLLYSLNMVRKKIANRYISNSKTIDRIDWDFAHFQLYGIEINDRIARVAMMDMVIHDDGHSNIEANDALADYKVFDPRKGIQPGKYTIVLTNPPFGAVVHDKKTLDSFVLAGGKDRQKTEILFIERCLDLLNSKKEGRLGIVVPDGILTNTSSEFVRSFIQENAKIVACISLPDCTFVPAGSGVKASLLFLKKTKPAENENYPIFMAIADHVGYDATGRTDENDLPDIFEKFIELCSKGTINPSNKGFVVLRKDLEGRIDPYYYQPSFMESQQILQKNRFAFKTLGEIAERITGGATPTAKGDAYTDKKQGVPFLRIQNITENGIDLTNVEHITREIHESLLKRSQLQPNDILFTITGRIGTTAVVPENFGEGNINQHMVKITLKDRSLNPYYIAAFLNSRLGQFQALRKVTGTTRLALDYEAIRSIIIPIPPREVQDRIANKVEHSKIESIRLQKESQQVLFDTMVEVENIIMGN